MATSIPRGDFALTQKKQTNLPAGREREQNYCKSWDSVSAENTNQLK